MQSSCFMPLIAIWLHACTEPFSKCWRQTLRVLPFQQLQLHHRVLDCMYPCRAGFTLSGALFRKKYGGPSPIFSSKKMATFFQSSSACHLFFSLLSLTQGSRPLFRYFRYSKNSPLLLWGLLFCVRPNMLNMPKSAVTGTRRFCCISNIIIHVRLELVFKDSVSVSDNFVHYQTIAYICTPVDSWKVDINVMSNFLLSLPRYRLFLLASLSKHQYIINNFA